MVHITWGALFIFVQLGLGTGLTLQLKRREGGEEEKDKAIFSGPTPYTYSHFNTLLQP